VASTLSGPGGVWEVLIVGAFMVVWTLAWLVWRLGRIEERWAAVSVEDRAA